MDTFEHEMERIIKQIQADNRLGTYMDFKLKIPDIIRGSGPIKLIILGQDPTVKNPNSRSTITHVLNLNKNGSLKNYIEYICNRLQLKFSENIYATNLLKNFFNDPPTTIHKIDIIKEFSKYWLPLLQKEINQYPNVPIISLGEPLLSALVLDGHSKKVRDYWGYHKDWKRGLNNPFRFILPEHNVLNRAIFPFPHQPSRGKLFYKERMERYLVFLARECQEKD
ncbi:MAG: hypothetical protein GF353_06080 [Candidatus Lokiarchaeota archaeon]|nr:hypothetical protein [Candidatus Lokiarchaeota archaeon]